MEYIKCSHHVGPGNLSVFCTCTKKPFVSVSMIKVKKLTQLPEGAPSLHDKPERIKDMLPNDTPCDSRSQNHNDRGSTVLIHEH